MSEVARRIAEKMGWEFSAQELALLDDQLGHLGGFLSFLLSSSAPTPKSLAKLRQVETLFRRLQKTLGSLNERERALWLARMPNDLRYLAHEDARQFADAAAAAGDALAQNPVSQRDAVKAPLVKEARLLGVRHFGLRPGLPGASTSGDLKKNSTIRFIQACLAELDGAPRMTATAIREALRER